VITSPAKFKPRLLITGGKGQVASAILNHALSCDYQLIFLSHEELDISHPEALMQIIQIHQPEFIINTAAYTKVDQAEVHQAECFKANHEGVKQLAIACKENNIPLIHLSTDYIFDGHSTQSYTENHPANPLQIYGQSKWLGEEAIRQTCKQFIILRVSGIFSEYGQNFVKTMLRLAKEKPVLTIVSDQFTCPTYAGDIADVIFKLINNYTSAAAFADTLHFCTGPAISWYEFANEILYYRRHCEKRFLQRSNPVTAPISTADYPTLAKRPLYSVLNCEKIKNNYGIIIPDWTIGLKRTVEKLS
jgi:dTDP-4-dehydrorhamnose reductase